MDHGCSLHLPDQLCASMNCLNYNSSNGFNENTIEKYYKYGCLISTLNYNDNIYENIWVYTCANVKLINWYNVIIMSTGVSYNPNIASMIYNYRKPVLVLFVIWEPLTQTHVRVSVIMVIWSGLMIIVQVRHLLSDIGLICIVLYMYLSITKLYKKFVSLLCVCVISTLI